MKALKHNWVAFVLLVFSFLLSFSCVRNDRSIEIEILPEGSDSKTLFFFDQLDFAAAPPDRDLKILAVQYGREPNENLAADESINNKDQDVGDREQFVVTDLSSTHTYGVEAELVSMTDSALWYVDIESDVDRYLYKTAATQWEAIYKNHFSKTEIPRITILNTAIQGAAGYFSDIDSYPRWVHANSNQRPMIYIDPHRNNPDSNRYMSVLIHEFQHLIHNFSDPGEEAWVDEGLAELVVRNVGYETPLERYFLINPDTQLNFWPAEPRRTPAHYGASSLFFEFVFGEIGNTTSLESLMKEPLDGIAGVESWLSKNGTNFHEEFRKWVVANYLGLGFDEFSYPRRNLGLKGGIDELEMGESTYQVSQYGTRYFETNEKDIKIMFKGNRVVDRFKTRCTNMCWWSNKGDSIDSSLMLKIDLTTTKNPMLHFDLWHDIEEGWDYGYISVSSDQGKSWRTLETSGTTTFNPVGASYGYGYSGQSDWISHTVPLADFISKEIQIKFQYVTDAAVHLDGMLIENIRLTDTNIDSIDQKVEFDPAGFVLVDGSIRQNFLFQIIKELASGKHVVDNVPLDELNEAVYSIPKDENLAGITIVISGMSGLTQQPGIFDLVVSKVLDK
ncbi:MAG: hypothetical protein VX214_00735 [Chloroflexota bacterium]|nr:hypothetical protein [Chloroflexota bacterium]MED5409982.1 hypothetical protein [Chloroflexota bacterium]MED5450336.1 hypothetical protein [Chloroflexota bacterium]MEE3345096.1 hypothetical protein [Chloroflexota bacterium]